MDFLDTVKFDANGLIPAIAQDHATGEILMVAYMNKESLQRTVEKKQACYWSRSRQEFWIKGARGKDTGPQAGTCRASHWARIGSEP